MKLHLPVILRKAVLACSAVVAACTLYSGNLAAAADITLTNTDALTIDYAEPDSIVDLEGGTLQLMGDTPLQLSNCGEGDGKVYTLFTGISQLTDKEGNVLSAGNYTVADYFDTTLPGTGFWAESTLQLTQDGTLQLVRHNEAVNDVLNMTTHQNGELAYSYHEGVAFNDISYSGNGGAIYGSPITFNNNGSVQFSANKAYSYSTSTYGGAIYVGYNNAAMLNNNGSVTFSGNTARSNNGYTCGGAIFGYKSSTIELSNNDSIVFSENAAKGAVSYACGGAILGLDYSSITMSNNGIVVFQGNTANSKSAYGGAIVGADYSSIILNNNGSLQFIDNAATSVEYIACGGAIYGGNYNCIVLSNNSKVLFSGNTASGSRTGSYTVGGAISGETITLNNNGSVTFMGNTASSYAHSGGGAIQSDTISLNNNGIVLFSGNTASGLSSTPSQGGAILSDNLSITNNEDVIFEKNAEVNNGNHRLRSIYVNGYEAVVSLSAAEGKSIEFRDSVYICSGSTVNFNVDYTDAAGIIHQQAGDIIFTGATTEADLLAVKGSAGTATEIANSRTTEVLAMTNLYGGRLSVEGGAIYKGYGITAMANSGSTVSVRNATLRHSGYDLLFNSGTTLELQGSNTITGNLNMLDGSTLHVDFTGNDSVTDLGNSNLTLSGDMQLLLTGAGNGDGKTYILFTDIAQLLDKEGNVLAAGNYTVGDYFDTTRPGTGFWADATLQLTQEDTLQLVMHDEIVKDALTVTTRQPGGADCQYYAGVLFENIKYTSNLYEVLGGAAYGSTSSSITLSNNGSVVFRENEASSGPYIAYGGAIYVSGKDVTSLSDNGRVEFSGNTASSGSSYAKGGAIYVSGKGVISLSANGSVEFCGNKASGSSYAQGGAIYGNDGYNSTSTITMINNGSVVFCENTASSASSYAYGGAICGVFITLSNNKSVEFSGNTASGTSDIYGGAIFGSSYGTTITLSNNGCVKFNGNTASAAPTSYYANAYVHGGAIAGAASDTITLSNNGSVEFSGNTASAAPTSTYANAAAHGGAIFGGASGTITLSNNGSVSFYENSASSSSEQASGGAIYGSSIALTNNGSVSFIKNSATAPSTASEGGAISTSNDLTISNNGDVTFSNNSATYGGAIYAYGGAVTISNNGDISFNGNSSLSTNADCSAWGGAVYASGNLTIQGNDSVSFEKNYEVHIASGSYRLRGIYLSGVLTLSGDNISFYDSIHTLGAHFNSEYTDAKGNTQSAKGDIIFSGKYAEQHLNEILTANHENRTATAVEVQNSQTSTIFGITYLYGGRLRVEDGAVYQGYGITVTADANATILLKNATLKHEGYDITLNRGNCLSLSGINTASAKTLNMSTESILSFSLASENLDSAVLTFSGDFNLVGNGGLQIHISTTDDLLDGQYKLLTMNESSYTVFNLEDVDLTINNEILSSSSLQWLDNTLYFNYRDIEPLLVVGTWCNKSGDGIWNDTSQNWTQDGIDYTYHDGVQVCFGDLGAGKVTLEGILAPSSVLVNSREDYSFEGTGSLTGGMSLTKQGSGTLTITTNNSYTGDTLIEGGTLVVAHANALGSSTVTMNGGTLEIGVTGLENTITSNGTNKLKITESVTHILTGSITNSGTLTLCGSFNASKLSKSKEWNSYVTVDNVVSTDGSGFLREGDFEVTIATGTVDSSSATIKYGEQKLVMNGGVGTGIGTMNYENYRILSGNTASSSAIHAYDNNAGKNALISLSEGGTLNADDADTVTLVNATGGTINLGAGTLNGNIGGNTTVSVIGTGTIYGNNSYTGGTTIEGGRLEVGHANALGTGTITLNGGTLDLNSYAVGNEIFATGGTLEGGDNFGGKLTVNGDLTLGGETTAGGGILLQGGNISGGSTVDTDITVNGSGDMEISSDIRGNSSLTLNNGDLTISGSNNNYTGGTTINKGNLTIGSGSSLGSGNITLNGGTLNTNGQEITNNIVNNGGSLISSYVLGKGHTLTVGKGGMSMVGNLTLAGGNLHFKGLPLTVDGKVTSTAPVNVLVCGYSVIDKEGTVQLADFGNNTVGVTAASFNNIGYGSLNYDEATSTLSITLTNKNIWVGGKGSTWIQGTNVGWANGETFAIGNRALFNTKGTVTITGAVEPASALVDVDKSLTFKTSYNKKTGLYSGSIVGNGCVVKRGVGKLTMNDGNTYSGGTFIEAGTVNALGTMSFGTGAITLSGGTLNLASKVVANDIELTDSAIIKGGKKYHGTYTQTDGELMKGSVLNIAATATLTGGVMNGTLSGYGTVAVTGDAAIGTSGKVTTYGLEISGTLAVSNKGLAMNTKTSAINVKTGGKLLSEGALKAAALTVDGGLVELHSNKASAIAITNNISMLNAAEMTVYAKVKTANLTMTDSQLHLGIPNGNSWANRPTGGGSIAPVPLSLSVSGSMNLTSSALTLSGKITAGNLTITDSYVNMTSGKLQPIAVKNTLTLSGDNSIIFDFDASNGKSYKLFTFKEFKSDGSELHELLGWDNNGSYILKANAKDITLTVVNASAWEAYMDTLAHGESVAAESENDEIVESAGAFVLARPADAGIDPMLGKVADTLVQSTWGTAGASRAFGDTIAARGTHATALADGKAAAWISTMGGSSRISSDGAHAGADYTLTGAAFGMEASLSEKSTVGLSIGNSWGKVSTFSAFPVDQDSTHQGIYGKHLLGSSTTLSWMAAHTRTESDAKLAGIACDWTQDALQLDARVDKLFAISDRTTVSAFVGMQYLATDKGECNGLSTGSLQNLRGEIGVSAAHKATDRTYIYGELSFIGDMVRHNPTATVGDYRSRGANPGRTGLNLSVGASYQLNDSWSLNGSYSLELMQNQTSHSANVGATYSF